MKKSWKLTSLQKDIIDEMYLRKWKVSDIIKLFPISREAVYHLLKTRGMSDIQKTERYLRSLKWKMEK